MHNLLRFPKVDKFNVSESKRMSFYYTDQSHSLHFDTLHIKKIEIIVKIFLFNFFYLINLTSAFSIKN